MPRPAKPAHEKVAEALAAAKQAAGGGSVLRAKELSRARAELLKKGGWLLEIYAGWYALVTPGGKDGDTVPFFSNYWEFIRKYLDDRLDGDWALSAIASLAVHTDSWAIPRQLSVHTGRTTQSVVDLPHGLSLAVIIDKDMDRTGIETTATGLRILSLERALAAMPASAYRLPSPELVAAVATVRNIPELTRILLASPFGGPAAGRLVQALRGTGRGADGDAVERIFIAAGAKVGAAARVDADAYAAAIGGVPKPPAIATRLSSIWSRMSGTLQTLDHPRGDPAAFLQEPFADIKKRINEVYVNDAYNSLSIEGYQVTTDLIARVASGGWDPKKHEQDKQAIDALAARGYFEAFGAVTEAVGRIHAGEDAIDVLERACLDWRGLLFAPAARAGLLPQDSLAGYRRGPVYIRGSMHVPPPHEKLMDAMDTLFARLRVEKDPWTRAVLAHYVFVNIHPFPDGNGRVGRFLMNALLVAGGLPWTVVRVARRTDYMAALEAASIGGDIAPLSVFLQAEMVSGGNAQTSHA